jgi:hypothetical protein
MTSDDSAKVVKQSRDKTPRTQNSIQRLNDRRLHKRRVKPIEIDIKIAKPLCAASMVMSSLRREKSVYGSTGMPRLKAQNLKSFVLFPTAQEQGKHSHGALFSFYPKAGAGIAYQYCDLE